MLIRESVDRLLGPPRRACPPGEGPSGRERRAAQKATIEIRRAGLHPRPSTSRAIGRARDRSTPDRRRERRRGSRIALAVAVTSVLLAGAAAAGGSAVDATPWVPETAAAEAGHHGGAARLNARLLVDAGRSTPDRARIGVLFDLDPDWHLYWRNPGDTGIATALDIRSPGATVGDIEWPAPVAFSEADGLFVTFGYEDRVLLATDLDLDPAFDEERMLEVEAEVLICRTECIPASVSVSRSLTEALVDSPDNIEVTKLFRAFEATHPVEPEALGIELEALYSQSALRPGDAFDAAIAVRSCVETNGEAPCTEWRAHPDGGGFFPDSDSPVLLRTTGVVTDHGDHASSILGLDGQVDDALAEDGAPDRLTGVLALKSEAGTTKHVRVDLPLPFAAAGADVTPLGVHWRPAATAAGSSASPAAPPALGMLRAVLLAMLGGLILNLMPCVLPVLAIKVFAVAELAGRSRRELVEHGVAYAGGILASMGALAAVVLTLRGVGTQVGWGFQFQSPLFVSAIAIVLVAFALNLFGVFEISVDVGRAANVGSGTVGSRRSFFEGLLAVVLATPCSAPFLGTAVGFAFASPPFVIVAIFLAIGVGLALPFVLISLIPGWARFMPRPGPWMLKLRAALGFALLATVIWLLWLTGGVSGVDGVVSLLVLLLSIAFGLFVYGAVQQSTRSWPRIASGVALVLLTVVGLDLVRARLAASDDEAPLAARLTDDAWAPWTPAAIDDALEEGSPVLVIFSAEWCITCKVNERVVLRSERVESELTRLGVRVLKADWTRRDERIRAELARHGRAGVPLYLVYGPGRRDEPTVLPELLSVGDVVESLRAAVSTGGQEAAS